MDSLLGILVGRALLGLAVAGIISGFTTVIFDFFSGPKLDRFLGYQAAFRGLGGMVFLVIAGARALWAFWNGRARMRRKKGRLGFDYFY